MYDLTQLRKLLNSAGLVRVHDGNGYVDLRKAMLSFVDYHEAVIRGHEQARADQRDRIADLQGLLADEVQAHDATLAEYRTLLAVLTDEPVSP